MLEIPTLFKVSKLIIYFYRPAGLFSTGPAVFHMSSVVSTGFSYSVLKPFGPDHADRCVTPPDLLYALMRT